MLHGFPYRRTAGLGLAVFLLCLTTTQLSAAEEADAQALEVRLIEPGPRIALTKGRSLLALAQIARKGAAPWPLPEIETLLQEPVLLAGAKTLRPVALSFPEESLPFTLSLQIDTQTHGVRLGIRPTRNIHLGTFAGTFESSLELLFFEDEKRKAPLIVGLDPPAPLVRNERRTEIPEPDGKTFRATRISLGGFSSQRMELSRSGPTQWRFDKSARGTLLTQGIACDPLHPDMPGAFDLYLGTRWDAGRPELSSLKVSPQQIPAGEIVEGRFRVYASGADVYANDELKVLAEIAFPTEPNRRPRVVQLPCFYFEDPANKAEGEFRFRFAPPSPGAYGIRILAIAGQESLQSAAVAVQANRAAASGQVRLSSDGLNFMQAEREFFFPLGFDYRGDLESEDSLQDLLGLLTAMGRAGGNTLRLHLGGDGLCIERAPAGTFRPEILQRLDRVLLAAQARDIYVMLVLESGRMLAERSAQHPYFKEQGGPLTAVVQFFHHPGAIEHYKHKLAYIAARYGAYRSLLSWELLSELDLVWPAMRADPGAKDTTPQDADRSLDARRRIMQWVHQATLQLKAVDAHRHLLSIQLNLPPERRWHELDNYPDLGFILSRAPELSREVRWKMGRVQREGRVRKPLWWVTTTPGEEPFATFAFGLPTAPLIEVVSDYRHFLPQLERTARDLTILHEMLKTQGIRNLQELRSVSFPEANPTAYGYLGGQSLYFKGFDGSDALVVIETYSATFRAGTYRLYREGAGSTLTTQELELPLDAEREKLKGPFETLTLWPAP